ncbi:MAG: hypothetical protein J2P20_14540 [Pseudonocardia sp.]|nr:hypothetical protein [Pseudonocardia sp.]MBO0872683.1 hypothetical protein [Pseudonocardia sp.]
MQANTKGTLVGLERMRRYPWGDGEGANGYAFDLTAREQRRLAAVYEASPDLDPGAVLAEEAGTHRMLYSQHDAEPARPRGGRTRRRS